MYDLIKRYINSFPNLRSEEIIRRIKPFSVVSFDIFDTLIKRNILGKEEVFNLVEKEYNKQNNQHITGFRRFRIQTEEIIRTHKKNKEFTIDDIYNYMIGKIIKSQSQSFLVDDSIAEILKKLEIEIETAVCQPNYELKKVFEYCKNKKKKIILISDMYLQEKYIRKVLQRNGYFGYESLYVSCDYGVSKQNKGKLFNIVSEKERINKKDWIHIGDSKKADWFFACKNGIKSVNIARQKTNTNYINNIYSTSLGLNILTTFINNNINNIDNAEDTEIAETLSTIDNIKNNDADIYDKKIGYEIYGPILYFFVRWLKNNLSKEKTTLFFARDCYIVKQAFELINGNNENGKYFLASRKSLLVPELKNNVSLNHLISLLKSDPKQFTVSFFCRKLSLDYNAVKPIAIKYGLRSETILDRDSLRDNKQFINFYREIKPYIIKEALKEYNNFLTYFNSLNCTREIQVVDIGWRCTMQSCLQELLPEHSFRGYYLGIREDAKVIPNRDAVGFFLNGEDDAEKKCFLAEATALIEMFFSAPHGSVLSYADDGSINYSKYEGEDNEKYKRYVEHIQEGALKFIIDFNKFPLSEMIEIHPEDVFWGLNQLNRNAKKPDLIKIGDFYFNSGIKNTPIAKPDHVYKYIFSPKKLIYDFSYSTWKVGFLKRLLKLRLPYHQIFSFIYKHR